MNFRKLVVLAAFAIGSGANAQTFSANELSLIEFPKNPAISAFLIKQKFPSSVNSEGAAEFAEKQGLLRDGTEYGSKGNRCKAVEFYFVGVGEPHFGPTIAKTITLDPREKKVALSKAEHQAEWDRIFGKLGKPRKILVSNEIWPYDSSGMIESVQYSLNHNGWPVSVTFQLIGGCLIATAYYSRERDIKKAINEAREKSKPKASAADGL